MHGIFIYYFIFRRASVSSEKEQKQPDVGPHGAEQLYSKYLRLRAERDKSGNETK